MKENGYRRKKTDDDYEYYKGKIDISLAKDRIEMEHGEEKKFVETLRAFTISIRSSDWFFKGYYK